jgi:hypothetical protein
VIPATVEDLCPFCGADHEGLCPSSRHMMVEHSDTRPRIPYVLPDGTEAPIIFDHGERVTDTVTFALRGGEVITIPLSPSYTGPRELPLSRGHYITVRLTVAQAQAAGNACDLLAESLRADATGRREVALLERTIGAIDAALAEQAPRAVQ